MMFNQLIALSAALAATVQATSHKTGSTIKVNPKTKYQVYDGTGISEAFQRSLVMHELDAPSQKLALDYLFTAKGAGFTILRNGLGSSPDQGWDLMKSIAPEAPESNSSQLNYIPLPRDDQYQVWLSYQAKARGVHTIVADSWSADGYMKTSGTDNNGGYLCGVTNATCESGDWRQAYADKIVKYLKDYKARGINIDYVNAWNEPDLNTSYASMQSNGQQEADFLKVLYPTLKRSGLKTQIACCDATGWDAQQEMLTGIQAAGQEGTLGLVTGHGYSSKPTYPLKTDVKVWQTEWSTFDPINYDWYVAGNSSEGLTWANNVQKAFTLANVTGHLYWWGAANTTDNQSLLFVNGTSEVKVTKRLWAHAHFGSKFIRKGARRIDVGVVGSSALNVSAFANTDGSTAVQVINNGNAAETVTLQGLKTSKHGKVVTYLTNQENDLKRGYAKLQRGNTAVAKVPAKSLFSFVV